MTCPCLEGRNETRSDRPQPPAPATQRRAVSQTTERVGGARVGRRQGRPTRIVGACCGVDGESWLQRLCRKDQGGGEREELRLYGVQCLYEGQTWNPANRAWTEGAMNNTCEQQT